MTITRVHWRERQRVSAADLGAEQLYRLQGTGRHLLAPHDWGVVRGLWLAPPELHRGTRWRLTEGVAVDGYGRELLVREPIEFDLPDGTRKDGVFRAFLYYCESPSSSPPCVPCREDPAPRTHQHVQLVVNDTMVPVTGPAADLALARAAGRVADLPAWPVLVGGIETALHKVTYAETRYHAQRASILRSPSGRIALRQGLLGPYDQYQLLLSTDPDALAPVKRLAIDRAGVAHVWKELVLSGATASAMVQLSAHAALMVQGAMPAGVGRRVVIHGVLEDATDPRLTLRWLDSTGAHDVLHANLLQRGETFLDHTFTFMDMHPVTLRLVQAARPAKRMQVVQNVRVVPKDARGAVGGDVVRAFAVQEFEATLRPSGGQLTLHTRVLTTPPADTTPCDPDRRATTAPQADDVVGGLACFRPAAQATPAPTVRAIQAVPEPRADDMPATVLRLSGGEFDEGDHSARVAMGARLQTAAAFGWRPIVSVDGGGRVRVAAEGTTLHVSHTLQLPPITTNPADPLTQDLLALSYSAGLRRAGRSRPAITVSITFATMPPKVKRGGPLEYTLNVNVGPVGALTVKRALECVVGRFVPNDPVENKDVALRTIPSPPVAVDAQHPLAMPVTIPSFQHVADHVVIAVELLVSVGGKDYACSGVSAQIEVTP
jgi:hypothetical protein